MHAKPLSRHLTALPILGLAALAAGLGLSSTFAQDAEHRAHGPFATMFWTWQDPEIEDAARLPAQAHELKAAGFDGVFAMPRATRYQLYDDEMIDAVQRASEACQREGLEFMWGPDPRFAAHHIVRTTSYGAEVLLTGRDFLAKTSKQQGPADRLLLNECRVDGGRYSLRYNYPSRRDVHVLTEAGLWMNPIAVDRVFAYQRNRDGAVVASSVRDITPGHHFFSNRSLYYVEVFGKADLPGGEWWVVAFPRFATNLYAFDAPEHEALLTSLLDRYKERGIHFDGFWWDEPGYYLQFGHYAISERIYRDFEARHGYDLRASLHKLLLTLDDHSELRVRADYFTLLMDYVFGAEKRFWERGEQMFGRLRMGVHHNWHSLPDNMYHGSADYWRGLEAVDAGYIDDSGFEGYFRPGLAGKYEQAAYLIVASSLGKFSRTGRAYYNRWGVEYGPEVPTYWNDLIAAFSNEWIQHAYGSTAGIDSGRAFGPGFPNHPTWTLLPSLIERTRQVYSVTGYRLPVAEVAVVYPMSTLLTGREPENDLTIRKVKRLIGAMPAAGVQVDAISEGFLNEGSVDGNTWNVRGQRYRVIVLPCTRVIAPETRATVEHLRAAGIRVVLVDVAPAIDLDGASVDLGEAVALDLDSTNELAAQIEALGLPSPTTRLSGAYVTVIPGTGDALLVAVMPIEPGATVGGTLTCHGRNVEVTPTSSLAIYEVGVANVRRVF